MSNPRTAAVVLAGGRGERLGGADKAGIEVGGRTLLAGVLDALADADEVVVVGDPVPVDSMPTFVREDPIHGGPAHALLTALDVLLAPAGRVIVVAVDMPFLTPHTARRLVEAAAGGDGAVLVDADGRRQLALVVDAAMLRACAPAYEHWFGLGLWQLLAPLDLVEVEAHGREADDVDSFADLVRAREAAEDPWGLRADPVERNLEP